MILYLYNKERKKQMAKYEEHKFYCLNCGRASIPIQRQKGHQYKSLHRKKLYCPYCKITVNHIECRTLDDEKEFLENFKNGVYTDEAAESISTVRSAGEW